MARYMSQHFYGVSDHMLSLKRALSLEFKVDIFIDKSYGPEGWTWFLKSHQVPKDKTQRMTAYERGFYCGNMIGAMREVANG